MAYASQRLPLMWNRLTLRKIVNAMDSALASGGVKGEKGDKGDTGAKGAAGAKGEKGDPGEVTQAAFDALAARVTALEGK